MSAPRAMRLSDETIDGLLYGAALQTALARSPAALERRREYDDGLRADREMLSAIPRERLVLAIVERRLWTLPGRPDCRTTAEMIDAISRCMRGNDRPLWLAALGAAP